MPKRKVNNDTKRHYVDKKELVAEVAKSQKQDQVTEELAEMFIKIVNGVAHRFGNLQYYGIGDDVKQDCLLLLIQKYKNFDLERKSSCFAFMTTIVFNQMRYQVGKAKKYKERHDEMSKRVKEYVDQIERGY
jgi:DNA-directed RNA polymerase specialized sigma24 family protein